MKKIILKVGVIALIICFHSKNILGQQEPQFTQYFDNTLYVNPAYAGSKGVLNLTGVHRDQWVGFKGRPSSTSFSIHTPLTYESVGVGFTMVNDQIGPIKQTMFYGDFSYSLRFKEKDRKLSFGIKGGLNSINLNTSELITTDANDLKLIENSNNKLNPNFGIGIYYHTPKFFVGASVPKIIQNSYSGNTSTSLERRHYFGIMGGVFDVNKFWKIRPTAQLKVTSGAPLSLDVSCTGIYKSKIYIGSMYRLNAAVGVFAQFQATPQFKIGFASDFDTHGLRTYNSGTYEVLASYDFIFKKHGIHSPRYF